MIKQKFIGVLIIIIGALPFLLNVEEIGNFFSQYILLSYLTPGEIFYQAIIIVLGAWLIIRIKPRMELERHHRV